MTYDVAIIGGGPAGIAAAIYSARKQLTTALIAHEIGGQSAVSAEIYNWIGTPAISGSDLAKNLKMHVQHYIGNGNPVTLYENVWAEAIKKEGDFFIINLHNDTHIAAKSVLVASGSHHRKLEIPGADVFDNKGVVYCATCDAPLFGGTNVAVVGGGNAAFEAVLQLAQYANSITLLHRGDSFRADASTIAQVEKLSQVSIVKNASLKEIMGNKFVEAIKFTTLENPEEHILSVAGVFVEIGQLPNTTFVKDIVALDTQNKIIVDPRTQRTSIEGIWAAGDCTNGLYHQNNIATGDAIKAIENLYFWLKTGK